MIRITPGHLTRQQMLFLLQELDRAMGKLAGARFATLTIVGGAAIAARWDKQRMSADVDSVDRFMPELKVAISKVAQKHKGLPDI